MQFNFVDALRLAQGLQECVEKKLFINVLEKLAHEWPEWNQKLYPSKDYDESITLMNEARVFTEAPGIYKDNELLDFQIRFDAHLKKLERNSYHPISSIRDFIELKNTKKI